MKRRVTASKQAIFDILHASASALSQEDIEQMVGQEVNRATVYRVLNSFCEDGYVHKVLSDDGKYYFAVCSKCNQVKHVHNHFHFRCTNCGKVECLSVQVKAAVPEGYIVQDMNCMLTGLCKPCATK